MLIGYARVSTEDQKLDLQHDALRTAGCDKVFDDKLSGTGARLPGRDALLAFARRTDTVVVWKLDRLGRSLRDLIEIVNMLNERGVGLRSLREALDTTTPAGKLTFHVFGALSEFEADVLRERTRAGLAAARDRGATLGRPRALTPEQIEMARTMMANPKLSARQVAEQLGVHRATLYRNLAARR
jgi:DNA invertase Pin-like site-specific DNA recombinase